ncbi:hypothetical protein [Lewinella sp. 4G2]|uniref:hypothetical protein n=1 Tax=Lewinella sp. 4G2 TaxID=1803372 RepID=UPI0007B4C004|nr:hypothetical protein [Lewinella sp. 4G2]OAV44488.1 hypothetical protein A3850_008285 [Lewinella sp. 4G2]
MTTATTLTDYGRELDFRQAPKSIFGLYRGNLINIIHGGSVDSLGEKVLFIQTGEISEENQQLLSRKLNTRKDDIGFDGELVVTEDTIQLVFESTIRKIKAEKIDRALTIIQEGLDQFGIPARFTEEESRHHGYYVLEGTGVVMDTNEASSLMRELDDHDERRREAENDYTMGAAGAILGGMLGVAAWVAVAYFTGYITTLGAFVIVFLSYLGYGKLNGKLGPLTKPILIVVNLILIVVAQFLTLWAEIRNEGYSIGDTYQILAELPDVRKEFFIGLALPLVFMAVAIFYIVRDVSVEGVKLVKAEKL